MLLERIPRMFRTIMVCMILPLLPAGASAQVSGAPPALTPGLHHLKLPRDDGPPIGYAISIPANYSPAHLAGNRDGRDYYDPPTTSS